MLRHHHQFNPFGPSNPIPEVYCVLIGIKYKEVALGNPNLHQGKHTTADKLTTNTLPAVGFIHCQVVDVSSTPVVTT